MQSHSLLSSSSTTTSTSSSLESSSLSISTNSAVIEANNNNNNNNNSNNNQNQQQKTITMNYRKTNLFSMIVALIVGIGTIMIGLQQLQGIQQGIQQNNNINNINNNDRELELEATTTKSTTTTLNDEEILIESLREKYKYPIKLLVTTTNDNTTTTTDDDDTSNKNNNKKLLVLSHQLIHLHHMKTGGTSIDDLLKCSMKRLEQQLNLIVPYTSIHECSPSKFKKCLLLNDTCQSNMNKASIMSFCAPIKHLSTFGFNNTNINIHNNNNNNHNNHNNNHIISNSREQTQNDNNNNNNNNNNNGQQQEEENNNNDNDNDEDSIYTTISSSSSSSSSSLVEEDNYFENHHNEQYTKLITVLRNPIDRIWSNYRFVTKGCYHCKSLKDVYLDIENNNTDQYSKLCIKQLINHQTINLVSTYDYDDDDDDTYIYGSGGDNNDNGNYNTTTTTTNNNNNNEKDLENNNNLLLLQNAITTLKEKIYLIGITSELEVFYNMLIKQFPFLSIQLPTKYNTKRACHLSHSNPTPTNNQCGPNRTHMYLPDTPPQDDNTIDYIIKYNTLDIQLYKEAIKLFNLQKKAFHME